MGSFYQRRLLGDISQHVGQKQVTVITGIRRSGKTTIARHVMDGIASQNKMYFDLENVETRLLFSQSDYEDIVRSLQAEGIDTTTKAYIVIDEIQMVPNITSVIKYLYDHYDLKFIVTGSSAFYLKNHFTESLAGRKRIFELPTLSFDEYLLFKGIRTTLPDDLLGPINSTLYNNLKHAYGEYLAYGGFPEVALTLDPKDKLELLKDIVNSYLRLDIQLLADFSKVDDIYKVIRLLTSRIGSKIDYSKLSSLTGVNRKQIKEYLLFFEQTYLIRQVPAFVKNRDREVALQKKLYFTDNGIVTALGSTDKGALLENSVANQLSLKGSLKYYARYTGQEIDFILNDNTAFEVKVTPTEADRKALAARAESIGIDRFRLIGLSLGPAFRDFTWAGCIA